MMIAKLPKVSNPENEVKKFTKEKDGIAYGQLKSAIILWAKKYKIEEDLLKEILSEAKQRTNRAFTTRNIRN